MLLKRAPPVAGCRFADPAAAWERGCSNDLNATNGMVKKSGSSNVGKRFVLTGAGLGAAWGLLWAGAAGC